MHHESFVKRVDDILRNSVEKWYSHRELLFSRMVKLGEEYGELCEHIMSSVGHGREDKVAAFDNQDLAKEFADVYIVLLLTARAADIDIKQAIQLKMEELEKRFTV